MRRFGFIALLFAMVVVLPPRTVAQETALVRLSFSGGWDALPALVALERGFFSQEGLVISSLSIANPNAVINSLAAGSTDFALVPQRVLLVMAGAKAPVKVVSAGAWSTQMELVARDGTGVSSLKDLKGKRIAVVTGSEALPVLMRLLNRQGMRPTDVKVQRLGSQGITQAFSKDLADAVFETRHFTSTLTGTGQATLVMGPEDVAKAIGYIGMVPLVASNKVIEREPKTVQRFLTGWVKGLAYIRQDPEDAARILQVFFHRQGVTVKTELAESWVGMSRYDQYSWTKGAIADAEYNGWGLNVGGILKISPKLDGYIDNSYAEIAVKTVGLK